MLLSLCLPAVNAVYKCLYVHGVNEYMWYMPSMRNYPHSSPGNKFTVNCQVAEFSKVCQVSVIKSMKSTEGFVLNTKLQVTCTYTGRTECSALFIVCGVMCTFRQKMSNYKVYTHTYV